MILLKYFGVGGLDKKSDNQNKNVRNKQQAAVSFHQLGKERSRPNVGGGDDRQRWRNIRGVVRL